MTVVPIECAGIKAGESILFVCCCFKYFNNLWRQSSRVRESQFSSSPHCGSKENHRNAEKKHQEPKASFTQFRKEQLSFVFSCFLSPAGKPPKSKPSRHLLFHHPVPNLNFLTPSSPVSCPKSQVGSLPPPRGRPLGYQGICLPCQNRR